MRAQLQKFYIEATTLFNRDVVTNDDVTRLNADVDVLANSISQWVTKNMGDAAAAKLFDPGTGFGVSWGRAHDTKHSNILNYLAMLRRNLSTLIETAAWDGTSKTDEGTPFK